MKYAIVGTGGRHQMFRRAITETYDASNELVALCDSNDKRLALSAGKVPKRAMASPPTRRPSSAG